MVSANLAYKEILPLENDSTQIVESPIKWTSVSLSDVIKRGKRLEASVFDVEARKVRQSIKNNIYGYKYLGGDEGLVTAYVRPRFKRIWLKTSDLPIFQPSSITDIKPVPDGYLSHRTETDINALRVHSGQILMTCSGTIGRVALVSKTLDNQIFSHDLLRIICKRTEDVGFVYAYLKSKSGQILISSNNYGSVITHIEPEHLATIPIPDAPETIKKRINDLVVQSYAFRDQSNELIEQATNLLVEALELPPITDFDVNLFRKRADVDTFSVSLSSTAGRLDASYHIPLVDAIVEHLKQHAAEVTTVGDPRISKEVILPVRFKRVYVEEGYGRVLLGGKQLYELDPTNKKYISSTKHRQLMNSLEISENTILITRSGTIGKVAIAPKYWEHWIPSDHIIRVVPANNNIAGYIYIFLQSDYAYPLITRFTYGSVVDEIDNNHMSNVAIPLLADAEQQKKINDMALNANELCYQAYTLEQKALQIMDEDVLGLQYSQ